jgi:PAS domain S-box-containing protein
VVSIERTADPRFPHEPNTRELLALFVWWNAAALDRIASENKRFENAVHDTQTVWLEILNHVSNAAFTHDLQGNLTFFNAAAERLFGVPAAEALGKNIYGLITGQSAETARSILSSRLIGGAPRPESLVLRTSAGEQQCSVWTTMICDHNNNPSGFFSLVSPLFTASTPDAPSINYAPVPISVA